MCVVWNKLLGKHPTNTRQLLVSLVSNMMIMIMGSNWSRYKLGFSSTDLWFPCFKFCLLFLVINEQYISDYKLRRPRRYNISVWNKTIAFKTRCLSIFSERIVSNNDTYTEIEWPEDELEEEHPLDNSRNQIWNILSP